MGAEFDKIKCIANLSKKPENQLQMPSEGQEAPVTSESVHFRDREEMQEVLGDFDSNLRLIRRHFPVRIYTRGLTLHVVGSPTEVERTIKFIEDLHRTIRKMGYISEEEVKERLSEILPSINRPEKVSTGQFLQLVPKVAPKTKGQEDLLNAIEANELVLCFGPAGTGKTFLSVASAISFFKRGLVSRIVLTRPAVEAGESLGYLPGTVAEKVNPYLVPLFDALNDILGFEPTRKLIERGVIEVAPLAFMRGRSLNNSFIILDEAQNTTYQQMKMFLTRMGRGSKSVVTGDITQIDLERRTDSGFVSALSILKGMNEGICIVELKETDIVRNPIVQRIINAYNAYEDESGIPDEPSSRKRRHSS